MKCPNCFLLESSGVKDSRPSGGSIRRRRVCENCQHRFTTFEVTLPETLLVEVIAGTTDARLPHYAAAQIIELVEVLGGMDPEAARLLVAMAYRLSGLPLPRIMTVGKMAA